MTRWATEGAVGGRIGMTVCESSPTYAAPPAPPAGAPNILILVLDDLGYADLGCYGGIADTPHIDALAAGGLRYTNFTATATCSATRGSLLTGRNHHAIGLASIVENATGHANSRGCISHKAATIAQVLRAHAYNTFALGKWHLAPTTHMTMAGPFEYWPLGKGFERYYGFLGPHADCWTPDLWQDNHRTEQPYPPSEGYHVDHDLIDAAVRMIRDQQSAQLGDVGKPFFGYLGFAAVHAPHHAPAEYLRRHAGRYAPGWDAMRARYFENQKRLGIIPPHAKLAPHNPGVRAWAELDANERRLFEKFQEAYAGFLSHADFQIGRLVAALEDMGIRDNTLIIVMSDNGSSLEGRESGMINELDYYNLMLASVGENERRLDDIGSYSAQSHYPWGWQQASATPFKWGKRWVHEGGLRVPFVVSWPAGIAARGELRHQRVNVTDVTPTVLDLLGLSMPETFAGVPQLPLHGRSFADTFKDPALVRPSTQYYEMLGNRGLYHDGWKLVCAHTDENGAPYGAFSDDRWELYDLQSDPTECKDLAAIDPRRVQDLLARWWTEAGRFNVLPLNDAGITDLRPPALQRSYRFFPHVAGIHFGAAPPLQRVSHTITAHVRLADAGANDGVLLAFGGRSGGYAFYIKDDHLVFHVNYSERARYELRSPQPIPKAAVRLVYQFTRTGDRSGIGRLHVDDRQVVEGPVEYLLLGSSSLEPFDVGQDTQSPVSPEYDSPFAIPAGRLQRVVVEVTE